MTARPLAGRLLGPTGFVLAALGVFLPFGAVSCEAAPGARETLTYTGAQLIGNGGGTVSMTPALRDELGQTGGPLPASTGASLLTDAHAGGLRLLFLAMLAVLLIGAATAAIRSTTLRHVLASGAALAGVIMLVGLEVAARHAVVTWFRVHPELPLSRGLGSDLPAGVAFRPGLGFWLPVGLLIVVGAASLLAALRTADPTTAGTTPATVDLAGGTASPGERPTITPRAMKASPTIDPPGKATARP